MPHSTAKFVVPTEEECWPVTMLLEMYPELRFERWLPSRLRTITKTSSNIYDERLLRGPNKRVLCLWCSKETTESGALFCSHPSSPRQANAARASSSSDAAESSLGEGCEHEHRVRRDGKYVRRQLFLRDQGVCAKCGIDAHELFTLASACCSLPQRNNMAKQLIKQNPEWDKKMRKPLASMEYTFVEGMFWEAAHKIDIKHGGGLCSLDGLQTLCVPCHTDEYMRNYAEEVRNLHIFQSPPAIERNKDTTPSIPQHFKSKGSSATSMADNGIASLASSLPQMHSLGTPTKQRPRSVAKKPGSVADALKNTTSAKPSSHKLASHIDLIVDLTSPHGKPVISFPDEDLGMLASKLTAIDISSDEQSSDDLEVLEQFETPKPKIQKEQQFQKAKRSELANSLCSSIVGTSPASPRTRPEQKRAPRRRFC
ncbi:hypothetical protein IW140_003894 [Coemansia sp. RSA 1813]|nr:hypothetical protein EV178_003708 [Coemansia sp. RSA 1646]KAJ1771905.1 hypothetical protein LPJ74_001939 [Coemansia sp. RSA 1843]KAJ2088627.1 hypothetical protein IW138_004117 [Coemansia sp. RSA 986]KAJ2211133.1 hypothetical protein EV179_005745 [Coemansia sp. RSA 487]KAJ2568351.1 hypothetical protein IW140_003894 [Coemansia sp. RSA 1813]